MILARTCTDAKDWVAAGADLGFPPDKSRNWTRYAFSSKFSIKHELLRSAELLCDALIHQPERASWAVREQVEGFGLPALTWAQAPECAARGYQWCPCL